MKGKGVNPEAPSKDTGRRLDNDRAQRWFSPGKQPEIFYKGVELGVG